MNVDSIHLQGTSETVDDTPKRAIALPLLPTDGAYSLSGTILAVEDAPTRTAVAFHPRFVGSVVEGKATDASSAQAMSAHVAAHASGTAPPQLSISGRQAEILLTGAEGKKVQWAWDLQLVTLTTPGTQPVTTGPVATPRPVGPRATGPARTTHAVEGSRQQPG